MSQLMVSLEQHALDKSQDIALFDQHNQYSYQTLLEMVEQWVVQLSLLPGQMVGLLMDNCPEWVMIDLVCIKTQNTLVPMPAFFTPTQKQHLVSDSQLSMILTDDAAYYQSMLSDNAQGDNAQGDGSQGESLQVLQVGQKTLYKIVLTGKKNNAKAFLPGIGKVTYTSGTTGQPKGVCLTQSHMEVVAQSLVKAVGINETMTHMALLPLAVLLENVAGVYANLLQGNRIYLPSSACLGIDYQSTPNFFQIINEIKTREIDSCILVPELLKGINVLLEKMQLRLTSLKCVAVGGANVSIDLLQRAYALDLPVYQGYGLSECASVVALNTPGKNKQGSVGQVLSHQQVQIAEDGEVIVRGALYRGYLNQQRQAQRYLRTGDVGYIDAEGYLYITGRKKNTIVTASGRNVSPEWVESELLADMRIAQAFVYANAEAEVSCLLVPLQKNASLHVMQQDDMQKVVDSVNKKLPIYAQINGWEITQAFTKESGLLTANGRLRRSEIMQYRALSNGILSNHKPIIINAMMAKEKDMTFFDRLVKETEQERLALHQVPQIQAGLRGEIPLETYVAYLEQAYHHVKHTMPLLMSCGAKLPDSKRFVFDAIVEYIEEEAGHDEWILNDIQHCGGDKECVRQGSPSLATELMVSYAYDVINRKNPVGFLGMVFVLEGTSIELATMGAEKIKASLGLSNKSFSYLLSHGSLDQEHIVFYRNLVNQLDDEQDKADIIHVAKMMFGLFANMFLTISLGQDEGIGQGIDEAVDNAA